MEKIKIAVILGTDREGSKTRHAANFVKEIGETLEEVDVTFVDPLEIDIKRTDEKDPNYSKITEEADGFFIVFPEYNHGYPGVLKTILDSEYRNYKNKAVALGSVASGRFGGIRGIQSILPVLKEFSMIIVNDDLYFPKVNTIFDAEGNLIDDFYKERTEKTWKSLIWMAKVLKAGRETIE